VPFANTAPLRRELVAALPQRPFALRFWDGTTVRATESPAPTFTFHSPRALAHVLRAPGELGLGRAYVDGLLEVDDLDRTLETMGPELRQRITLGPLDFNDNVRWHDLRGTENVKPVIDRDSVVATVVPPTKIEVVADANAPAAAAPAKAPAKKA